MFAIYKFILINIKGAENVSNSYLLFIRFDVKIVKALINRISQLKKFQNNFIKFQKIVLLIFSQKVKFFSYLKHCLFFKKRYLQFFLKKMI